MSNLWFSPSFSQVEEEKQCENKLKRKSKSDEKINKSTMSKSKAADKSTISKVVKEPTEIRGSWLKAFEPKSVSDLLLHPKKLEDLRNWFKLTKESNKNRILLLIGPTGCLKASSARLLAKEAGYDVIEYVSNQKIENELTSVENYNRFDAQPRQSSEFADFLLRSSNYQNVFSKKDRVIIVKDFPNVFLRKGHEEEFFDVLRSFKQMAVSPLIFILTETQSRSANIEYRLFPDTLRTELAIENISMNPITTTNMKRALKLICASLKSLKPNDEVLESVIAQSQGDIRNAVNNLQLMTQQGNVEYVVKKRAKKVGKTEKSVPQAKITKGVGKNELLDIFHGVGRALYPKFENSRLTHRPEDLADTFSTQPANFIELVHSNYMKKFSQLDDVLEMSEILSVSDIFQTEYRDADNLQLLNLGMVVRGAMVYNSQVTAGFQPISAYAIKKWRANEQKYLTKYENFENKLGSVRVTKRDYFCDYSLVVK